VEKISDDTRLQLYRLRVKLRRKFCSTLI